MWMQLYVDAAECGCSCIWMQMYVGAIVCRIQMMPLIQEVKCSPALNPKGHSLRNSVK